MIAAEITRLLVRISNIITICLIYCQILSFYLVFHDFTVLKRLTNISDLTYIILYMLSKFELQNHFLYFHLPLIEVETYFKKIKFMNSNSYIWFFVTHAKYDF